MHARVVLGVGKVYILFGEVSSSGAPLVWHSHTLFTEWVWLHQTRVPLYCVYIPSVWISVICFIPFLSLSRHSSVLQKW